MVVLVDSAGSPVGTATKEGVHDITTPRHLAFSCHVVDTDGRLLVTRRSLSKKTWPGVWTNAFCGHPGPGEAMKDAVRRRAEFELGLSVDKIVCALPEFGYCARDASGIEENEFCPVFIAQAASPLEPNPDEVAEVQWTTVSSLTKATQAAPWAFSPWLIKHFPELVPHFSLPSTESERDV